MPKIQAADFPSIVNVEVFRGSCNCSCRHCPLGRTDVQDRKNRFFQKDMSLNLFSKICSEISMYKRSCLRIHAVGEPLLWSGLIEAGTVAKINGVTTWLFTNGVTENQRILKDVVRLFDVVEVSVNSTSGSDYKMEKGEDCFDLVVKNLVCMRNVIRENAARTRLIVSRVQTCDEKRDNEFVEHWSKSGLVDDAFVRSYHTYNKLIEERGGPPGTFKVPCRVHWTRFNISCCGYAVVCFNELFRKNLRPEVVLGDLKRETIKEIWEGRLMKDIRYAELKNRKTGLPCDECSCVQPLFVEQETSECQLEGIWL